MMHTPKNLTCPHCGKRIENACDKIILSALKKSDRGLRWGELLEETKLAKGSLNSLISSGKVEPGLINRKVVYFLHPNSWDDKEA